MANIIFFLKGILAPLVTKSSQFFKNQHGQITIFFAVSIVIIITLLSFVVNVGLFVKAKINLQNATDAAAWSGAATQARQLTDIAYMNWEMRNVYKEWMFKYYVLGNLSAKGVRTPGDPGNSHNVSNSPNVMDFTIGPNSSPDKFNFPSICIHPRVSLTNNASIQGDLCSIYSSPGLPKLSFGFSSIDQTTGALTDALAERKAQDCAARSEANFNITRAWIYGAGPNNIDAKILDSAPHVAINRTGAWVKAIELAHRIRNMEFIVNTPPNADVTIEKISNLESQNFAGNERTIKAFASAYRNLGNDSTYDGRQLKDTFRLTEISPQAKEDNDPESLSNVFIRGAGRNFEKYYLDLKIMPINFVNFFTALISQSEDAKTSNDVKVEAKCEMSKIAFPVPGYILGFTKNPEVLTYYAVKGESEFEGLFNPIGRSITLTAYAAAKPFGGRVGPPLFNNFNKTSLSSLFARSDNKKRSLHYALGLELDSSLLPTPTDAKVPAIIPADNSLWVTKSEDVIGGRTDDIKNLKYVIPNLIYKGTKAPDRSTTRDAFFIYRMPAGFNTPYKLGLYDKEEFTAFSGNLGSLTGLIDASDVNTALELLRSPTEYEQKNYLIPSKDKINQDLILDSLGLGKASNNDARALLYAPLYGENLLYTNPGEVLESVTTFLNTQRPAIDTFVKNLFVVSARIRKSASSVSSSGINVYERAADFFYNHKEEDPTKITCSSMAGQFLNFFYDSGSGINRDSCNGHVSLPKSLEELYTNAANNTDNEMKQNVYLIDLGFKGSSEELEKIFSAYAPGNKTNPLGIINNPFLGTSTLSLRNFYSTKLVSISSLMSISEQSYGNIESLPLLSEGSFQDYTQQTTFQNPINLEDSTIDIFQ